MLYFDGATLIRTPFLILRNETGLKRIAVALFVWAGLVVQAVFSYFCMCLDYVFFMCLDYVFFPRVRRVPVRAPIFIVGNGRSGTTQMHRLLTGDAQQMSFFKTYELLLPSLTQKRALSGLAWIDRVLLGGWVQRAIRRKHDTGLSEVREMHDWQMDGAEEDDFIMLHNFSACTITTFFPYNTDYLDLFWTDRRPARLRRKIIGFYKAALQRQIYALGTDKIHCCKSPQFTLKVLSLLEVFPDARFVVMVRNPAETLPSLEHLMQWYWRKQGCSEALSQKAAGELSEIQLLQYRNVFEALKTIPENQQCIVQFPDLVADPRKVVEQIYDRFGLTVYSDYAAFLQTESDKARAFSSKHHYEKASDEDSRRYKAAVPELALRFGW